MAAKRSKREKRIENDDEEKKREVLPVGVDGTNAERNAGENHARTGKRRGEDSVSGVTYTAGFVSANARGR